MTGQILSGLGIGAAVSMCALLVTDVTGGGYRFLSVPRWPHSVRSPGPLEEHSRA
ncbi:hypothetical protein RERY_02590 [Rhodococcus erythropolis]|nr:hypothetical protein RERY_02590 [Rhodococcus erythropolis]